MSIDATPETAIVDGDGHLFENLKGIINHLPSDYRDAFRSGRLDVPRHVFPAHSIFHAIPVDQYGMSDRGKHLPAVPEWLDFLDSVGIEQTVLYPTMALHVGLMRDPHFAVALCRAYNDWVAEEYTSHSSGKFNAVALLPMQRPEDAAGELRRAVQDLGLVAGFLPGQGLTNHLGSPVYYPVYEVAEELGVGLSIHGAYHQGFGFDDYNHFAPAHALGHPFALLIALGGLVFNGVYDRFPGLRTAYLEGGAAWILLASERFSESYSAFRPLAWEEGLHLGEGVSVDDYLTDLVQSRRLVVGCEGGEHHLTYAVEQFGMSPFMYSSDFPHEVDATSCAHEIEELREAEMKPADVGATLGENARAFYRLEVPPTA